MGSALAIIVGQLLGAGKLKEAKETDTKLIFASVASCFVIGINHGNSCTAVPTALQYDR